MTGAFISSLSQTLLSTALPNIMSDFKITADVGQWLTTIYLLIAGIIVPTTAYLINRFSTRKLFITSMSIFSIGCIIALFLIIFNYVGCSCIAGNGFWFSNATFTSYYTLFMP